MSTHSTHITSLIFGRCWGLLAPVFADVPQSGAPAINQCRGVAANSPNSISPVPLNKPPKMAHRSLTSVAVLSPTWEKPKTGSIWGRAPPARSVTTDRAVQMCRDRNILMVAAAGNDGCDCLHVPAALRAVLAVGATDARGYPLDFSNWGKTYQSQGILALGENILGAKPGGGTVQLRRRRPVSCNQLVSGKSRWY